MDKRKVLEKILCSIDLITELENKLFESQEEKEISIIDNMTIRVQVKCKENYFPEVSKISNPLIDTLREILGVSEESIVADDVTNIACDERIPIRERVERLLELNE